jgi:hypothetical protein
MPGILEAELVSQPGGLFIIFAGDRLAQLSAEPQALAGTLATAGYLAHVPARAVVPLNQG